MNIVNIALIGSSKSGKTLLINSYLDNLINNHVYKPTLGSDFIY